MSFQKFKNLNREQKDKMSFDYSSGKTETEISGEYGVSQSGMSLWLKKMGVKLRGRGANKYSKNDYVFNHITSESAYWIGFLMADGCVSSRGNEIKLEICRKDLHHLHKFREFLKYSGPIDLRGVTCSLRISSRNIKDSLISYGVTPCKSLTCKVIGLENNRDFWRGVVDGDGCIFFTPKKPHISLCSGSKDFIEQFVFYSKELVPKWKGSICHRNGYNTYIVTLHCNMAKTLICNLYKDSVVYLDRKYELAKRLTGNFSFEDKYNEGHEASIPKTTNAEVKKEGRKID